MARTFSTTSFSLNGRQYQPPPCPVAVICLDGSADEYLDAALARDAMPHLKRMSVAGYRGLARGAMPSFTNVNNASIVTGVPPSVHGIGGNYFFDAQTGREVMMNSADYLRVETIFPAAARAGRKVAVITAKEKLRDIFARGLMPATQSAAARPALQGIAFSSEKADQARRETHGLDDVEKIVGLATPPIYSAEASLYVLQAGVALLQQGLADFLYLSTTDYMQHKFAPDAPEAVAFYAAIDRELGRLLQLGAVIGLTADHGMNAKQKPDGSPNVIYLQSLLEKEFGPGFQVILPITDPYVVHHGALGSFAVVHTPSIEHPASSIEHPASSIEHPASSIPHRASSIPHRASSIPHPASTIHRWLSHLPGITEVYDRETAARKLELPVDRLGDFVAVAGRDVVLGRTPEDHDLKLIEGGLRSHGGRYEEMVPFIFSHPLKPEYAARAAADPRNFDVFDFTLNGTQCSSDAHAEGRRS